MINISLTSSICAKQRKLKKLIERAVPFLEEEFKLPHSVSIVLTPLDEKIKDKITLGYATRTEEQFLCVLNSKFLTSNKRCLNTLAHEFTHIEQMHQQRLLEKPNVIYWFDHAYPIPTSFDQYLNQPWEIEARRRGETFAEKYKKILPMDYSRFFSKIFEYFIITELTVLFIIKIMNYFH